MTTKKPLSKKQKANLLTGQLLWKCSCVSELIKFLKASGYYTLAYQVINAQATAQHEAYRLGKEAIAEANKDV